MDKHLRNKMIEKARENGAKFGKKAELDFGAGAEWMYEQLVKNCSIPDVSDSFEVFSYSTFDKNKQWCHWSEGLTLVMKQGKNTIEVKGDDCMKITNALPRTFGGSY